MTRHTLRAASPRDRRHWTAAEARQFLQARRHDPMVPIWRLALDTGIRRSELTALDWADVDLLRRAITVRSPKYQTAWTVLIGTPTVTALRRLAMRQLVDQFRAGDTWVGGTPAVTGRLVVGPLGQPREAAFLTLAFRQAQRGVDVPEIPFHGLRFTSARIGIASGATVKAITARLGHLDAATTLEVWPHLLDPDNDEPEGDHR